MIRGSGKYALRIEATCLRIGVEPAVERQAANRPDRPLPAALVKQVDFARHNSRGSLSQCWQPMDSLFDLCPVVLMLASASAARRRLLSQAEIAHRVRVSGVDEASIDEADPIKLVQCLAQAKAEAVRSSLIPADEDQIDCVLGCDSLLVFQGEVFGKPADPAEAILRWQRMAGCWGELHTGHCLIVPPSLATGSQDQQLEAVTTRVQFARLAKAEIDAYVATGEPLQCAGGFALEGRGGVFIERIEGCFSNVIGLSLPWLRRALQRVYGQVP